MGEETAAGTDGSAGPDGPDVTDVTHGPDSLPGSWSPPHSQMLSGQTPRS